MGRKRVGSTSREGRIVARSRDGHQFFGLTVGLFELVVTDRPISGHAVSRPQAKIVWQQSRSAGPPAIRTPTEGPLDDPRLAGGAIDEGTFRQFFEAQGMCQLPRVRKSPACLQHQNASSGVQTLEQAVKEERRGKPGSDDDCGICGVSVTLVRQTQPRCLRFIFQPFDSSFDSPLQR